MTYNGKRNGKRNMNIDNISVDRIDSQKDYTIDNIQLVCQIYNYMKWDLKQDDFVKYCKHVVEYF